MAILFNSNKNKAMDINLRGLPVSKITGKPVIHFAHANGMPSRVYRPIFEDLEQYFTVVYIPVLGFDARMQDERQGYDELANENIGKQIYKVDNHWKSLTKQIINSVQHLSKLHQVPVIGVGHSLGALCTLQAMYKKPKYFQQAVLMDPPIIYGYTNLLWHIAKLTSEKLVDRMSPAGISKHRRDVWDSREQASELLAKKAFFKDFDSRCFDGYIQHGLYERDDGKVTLTIPKEMEVDIFKTNPSLFWLKPNRAPKKPVTLLIGESSQFYKRKFPQKIEKRLSIPFKLHEGGHMFPLEYPDSVAKLIVQTIKEQVDN